MGMRYVFSMTTSDSASPLATSPRCRRVCCEMLAALAGFASLFTPATLPWAWASLVSASVPASATDGAPGFMDSSGSTAAGRTSYTTSMRSSASSAMAGSSAATAATGWPANTTRSIARTAWARVGAFFLRYGMSAAVSTARTPASAFARLVSMRVMRACACGLRSSFAWSRPLGLRSATYCTWPVTFSGPSGRGMESPTPFTSRVVFITDIRSPFRRHAGGLGDRGDHRRVARAAAEVARDRVADLLVRRLRVLVEQGGGGHEHAGNAEPALRHAVAHERLLHRREHAGARQPLDGRDRAPARLHGQHQAARHEPAVEVDGARAAVAGPAALLGAGEAEVLAQRVEQRHVRLHERLHGVAVHGAPQDLFGHPGPPIAQARARESASVSVRRVRMRTR